MFKWERECFMLLSLPAWAKLRVRSHRIWQELDLSRKSESSPTPIHSLCSEELQRCKLRLYECLKSWLSILHQCIVQLPVWNMQGEWTINGTDLRGYIVCVLTCPYVDFLKRQNHSVFMVWESEGLLKQGPDRTSWALVMSWFLVWRDCGLTRGGKVPCLPTVQPDNLGLVLGTSVKVEAESWLHRVLWPLRVLCAAPSIINLNLKLNVCHAM